MVSATIYGRFPLSECSHDNLKDSSKSLTVGLNSSVKSYQLMVSNEEAAAIENDANDENDENEDNNKNENDFGIANDNEDEEKINKIEIQSKVEYLKKHLYHESEVSDLESDYDESDYEEPAPEPYTPSSSPSAFKFDLKSNLKPAEERLGAVSLSLTRNKIASLITEYFPGVLHDEDYCEIKNYVVNTVLQSFGDSDINTICNKIIRKSYRSKLVEQIRDAFVDKYEEINIDSYFDYVTSFLTYVADKRDNNLLNKPNLYEKYSKIWKLDKPNFKIYTKDYFTDEYFDIFQHYKSKKMNDRATMDLYVKSGFLMNFDKFYVYYTRDLKSGVLLYDSSGEYSDESDYDDFVSDTSELDGLALYSSGSNYTIRSSVSSGSSVDTSRRSSTKSTDRKSLRFNDNVEIVSVNQHQPVNSVHIY